MKTVYTAFEESAVAHPSRPFLQVFPEAIELSYGEALAEVRAIAARYRSRGYGAGHRVALQLPNCPEFLPHFLALNSLGVSVVPLNPDYKPAELAYVLAHSEACAVIAQHNLGDPPAPGGSVQASECALLYTSGTTGKPKGCLLSNFYFLNAARRYLDEGGLCALRAGEERLITPLPLFHMNSLAVSTMAMILSGGCVVQLDRFHPKTWWRDVAASRATIVHYLGVMPAVLLSLPADPAEQAHGVRFGYGANANPRDHAAFEARFGFPLIEAWAMTETGGGALVAASREPRHVGQRCVGTAAGHFEYRIDPATNEFLVRHSASQPRHGFFSGYLKDEQATEAAWAGGWFHTGDCLREGPDGALHFVDRRKNIIRRAGENIAALEVEAVLAGHPAISAVAVIAAPDPLRDEEVMACVVAADRSREAAISIQDWCLERLAYFKAPGLVAFIDSLPVTATNKVQKAKLADFALNPTDCYDLRERKRRAS